MARIDNQTSLTREQLETLAKVTKDVFFFSLFVYIVDIRLKKSSYLKVLLTTFCYLIVEFILLTQ